jgi:hypothetical protein
MISTTTVAQPQSERGHTVTSKAPSTASTDSNDERIRERAYGCWEEAGCPADDGVEFWLKAEARPATESQIPSTTAEPRASGEGDYYASEERPRL